MNIKRMRFLVKFEEYAKSVLKWDGGTTEMKPSVEEMIENIENGGCPFYFLDANEISSGFDIGWFVSRTDSGVWTKELDYSEEFNEYSAYFHKFQGSKVLKKQILKILESLK